MTVTVTRGASNQFNAVLTLLDLPTGITGSFSPSTLNFSAGGGQNNQTRTSTLTVNAAANMLYGTYTFKVRATATNSASDWAEFTVTLLVGTPKPQTISFDQPNDMRYGDAATSLSASASSGLPVEFNVVSGPASVSGNSFSASGVGSVIVRATQPGTDRWLPSDPVDRTLTIHKGLQTLTLSTPEGLRYGMGPVTLQSASSANLPITLSAMAGPIAVSGTEMTITGAGSATIRASQQGSDLYEAAPPVEVNFVIGRGTQVIILTVPDPIDAGAGSIALGVSSTSGLPVEIAVSSGPGWTDGHTLHIQGHGALVLVASQFGTNLYEPAPTVVKGVNVLKRGQSIAFAPLPLRAEMGDVLTLQAESTSGLPVTFRVLAGPAVIEGNKLRLGGKGVVRVIAEQPGNSVYNPAQPMLQMVYVSLEPLMGEDDYYTVRSGELLVVEQTGVLANDRDGDIATPTMRLPTQHGFVELDIDGSFVYRSRPGFVGTDTFFYRLTTKHNTSEEITVTIEVRA